MCIVLVSTAHPSYAYIVLSNRDEYLRRPTLHAAWWKGPNSHILGGRDLQRSVQGTWLGLTRQGRLAVLTNFREEGAELIEGARSRGEIPSAYLTVSPDSPETPEGFAQRLVEEEGVKGVGGFSLVFGQLRRQRPSGHKGRLGVISNRTPDAKGVVWTDDGTWGLSNSHFGDRAWPKVVEGERLLQEIVERDASGQPGSAAELIEDCFRVLSVDTLPKRKKDQDWQSHVKELRHSIFIPAVGDQDEEQNKPADELAAATGTAMVKATSGVYGTQKQTVILVDHQGHATFVERTLYGEDARAELTGSKDRVFRFDIEGWED